MVDDDQNMIAEMFFRLESNQITHSQKFKDLSAELGTIGGLSGFLNSLAVLALGGYIGFNQSISIMNRLYFKDRKI